MVVVSAINASNSTLPNKNVRPLIKSQPNIVIILMDDLDWSLGKDASTLQRTRRLIGEEGMTFTNWLVQSPVCCMSRAELFTGKMFHNLRFPADFAFRADGASWIGGATMHFILLIVGLIIFIESFILIFFRKILKKMKRFAPMAAAYIFFNAIGLALILSCGRHHITRNEGCMHIDVADDVSHPFYDRDYFARFFHEMHYSIGIFGKHLNGENPTNFLPKGVDEMLINGGGTFFDPSFTVATRSALEPPRNVAFDNCTSSIGVPCYSTSIVGNASLAWIQRHVAAGENVDNNKKPFFALISLKAPHIEDGEGFPKATPAPWYFNTTIPESKAPRTPVR